MDCGHRQRALRSGRCGAPMTARVKFQPWPILAALERHEVLYIVIGGIAAVLRGAPFVTCDLDISPSREPRKPESPRGGTDRPRRDAEDPERTHRCGDSPPRSNDCRICASFAGHPVRPTRSRPDPAGNPRVRRPGASGYADRDRGRPHGRGRSPCRRRSLKGSRRTREAYHAQLPLLRETLEQIRRRERDS